MNTRTTKAILALACAGALMTSVIAQTAGPAVPAATPASTQAVDPSKVVIEVGNTKMTAKEFDEFIADLPPENQEMAKGPARRMLADKIVEMKVLAEEARSRGLDKTPKYQRQLGLTQDQLLASLLIQDDQAAKDKNNEVNLKAEYEKHKPEYETVHARHILIRGAGSKMPVAQGKKELSDAEAKAKADEVHKRVTEGKEDFGKVASAESDDPGSARVGGDLQPFKHGDMVKPFEQAAFALKPGEISSPVKSEFGYHIIKLEDKKTPTFDQMKDYLSQKDAPDKVEKLVSDLKAKYKPQVDPAFFGPAPATKAAAAPIVSP